jgi:hypothetical protein
MVSIKSFLERNHLAIAIVAALLLLLSGVFYAHQLGDMLRYLPDEQDYVNLAQNLSSNGFFSLDGLHPAAYRAPGYPLLLALLRFIGGQVVHFRFLNFVLLAASVFIVQALLLEQSTPLAASLGVLFFAAYPVLFYTAGTLYPQTLAVLLLLLVLFIFTRQEILVRHYLVGGLLLGYLILTVPTFAFLLAVIPVWLWWHARRQQPAGLVLATATALLLIGLWTFRNYTAFHMFVFISSNSGENLLLGNSENTRPNAGVNVDISQYRQEASGLDDARKDAYYRERALDYIVAHPQHSARMYLLKFLNYFNYRNELVTDTESSSLRDLLVLFTYGPLVLLAGLRLAFAWKMPLAPFELLLLSIYMLSGLVMAVFFTRIRFRLPFDVLLILLAAIFLSSLAHRWLAEKDGFAFSASSRDLPVQTGDATRQSQKVK